jgi:hypothetical protein
LCGRHSRIPKTDDPRWNLLTSRGEVLLSENLHNVWSFCHQMF